MWLNRIYIFLLLIICFINAHSQKRKQLNIVDSLGKKQGYWVHLGKDHKDNVLHESCYKLKQKVSEGIYLNNRKKGEWKEYYCNGKLKSSITFVDGRANGPAKMYYENGKIKEEGYWFYNRWIGKYISYDENGVATEYDYSETPGKNQFPKVYTDSSNKQLYKILEGDQTLYNKNKQIVKKGIFKNDSLLNGLEYKYDTEGKLKSIYIYKNGIIAKDSLIKNKPNE